MILLNDYYNIFRMHCDFENVLKNLFNEDIFQYILDQLVIEISYKLNCGRPRGLKYVLLFDENLPE